jgi:putative FmdB family regulatory protein
MPIFEFECESCHKITERICSYSESISLDGSVCDECGGIIKKKVSVPALKFVGPGFYETEYARKERDRKRIQRDIEIAKPNIEEQERARKKRFQE